MAPRNAYIQSCKVFSVQNRMIRKNKRWKIGWKTEKGKISLVKLK